MVTKEPSPVFGEPTGILPHVDQTLNLQKMFDIVNECLTLLKNQVSDIKAVSIIVCLTFYYILLNYI